MWGREDCSNRDYRGRKTSREIEAVYSRREGVKLTWGEGHSKIGEIESGDGEHMNEEKEILSAVQILNDHLKKWKGNFTIEAIL